MDAIRVRPVGFDCDHRETFLDNQLFGNLRALEIKFVRTVRRFTEQNEARVPNQVQERIVIGRAAAERLRDSANDVGVAH